MEEKKKEALRELRIQLDHGQISFTEAMMKIADVISSDADGCKPGNLDTWRLADSEMVNIVNGLLHFYL